MTTNHTDASWIGRLANKLDREAVEGAIRTHIEASAPCSMAGVMHWATAQGFGGTKAVQAIQALKNDRIIDTSFDDDNAVIIDLV